MFITTAGTHMSYEWLLLAEERRGFFIFSTSSLNSGQNQSNFVQLVKDSRLNALDLWIGWNGHSDVSRTLFAIENPSWSEPFSGTKTKRIFSDPNRYRYRRIEQTATTSCWTLVLQLHRPKTNAWVLSVTDICPGLHIELTNNWLGLAYCLVNAYVTSFNTITTHQLNTYPSNMHVIDGNLQYP